MTKEQMVLFYRQTSLFGADESENSILRFLARYCPGLADNMITFDEFASVSLKLAQR